MHIPYDQKLWDGRAHARYYVQHRPTHHEPSRHRGMVWENSGLLPDGNKPYEGVRAAWSELFEYGGGLILPTLCSSNKLLSERVSGIVEGPIQISLKKENQQQTGSYKVRGAINAIRTLILAAGELPTRIIAASTGNHGRSVALAASQLGIPCTIVMPAERTPHLKVENARAHGATVILMGKTYNDAYNHALSLAERPGYLFIDPDAPRVVSGQGTIAEEIFAQQPDVDVIVVPTGGASLLAGMLPVVRTLKPTTELIGVQGAGALAVREALKRGRPIDVRVRTIAEAIAVARIHDYPFHLLQAYGVQANDLVGVSDSRTLDAMRLLLSLGEIVEPAGSVGVAALLYNRRLQRRLQRRLRQKQVQNPRASLKVVAILTGGNVDLHQAA